MHRADRISASILSPNRDDDWRDQAACVGLDPEMFFPLAGTREEEEALATCRRCPVTDQCGRWADEIGATHGVWAGEVRGHEYPPMGRPRRCGWCHRDYVPYRPNQRYCTVEHRVAAERARARKDVTA